MTLEYQLEDLVGLIADQGWQWRGRKQDAVWELTWANRVPVALLSAGPWLTWEATLATPPQPTPDDFYRRLLQLNDRIFSARIGMESDGRIVLLQDLALETLSPATFASAARTFATYLQRDVQGAIIGNATAWRRFFVTHPPYRPTNRRDLLTIMTHLVENLQDLGGDHWRFRRKPDRQTPHILELIYRGALRDFLVYACYTGNWIVFLLRFGAVDPHPSSRSDVSKIVLEVDNAVLNRFLLRLNRQLFIAKFILDSETAETLLSVEIPIANFTVADFRRAATALATYAERYFYEVQILQTDTPIANLLATTPTAGGV